MRRKGIIIAAAAGFVLAAGLILLILHWGSLNPDAKFAAVYVKGSQNLFVALPEGNFPLLAKESARQEFSENGRYLYYDSVVSEESCDVYLMQLNKAGSRKAGGKPIAKNVKNNWAISADGRSAVWIETNGSRLKHYNAGSETALELASGVDALYAGAGLDVIYFTKSDGELFRCNLSAGGSPERMTSGVQGVQFYSGDQQSMLYYLLQSADSYDLYKLTETGGAALIAQSPTKVLFESYKPGGNLYYLKQAQAAAVHITITDPQETSDAAMKAPQKPSQPQPHTRIGKWLSEILGADSAGNAAYNNEKKAYDNKVMRDKVRAAAKEALETMPETGGLLDCYVYNGESSQLIASGVPQEQLVLRSQGRPALLYNKLRTGEETAGTEEKTIALETLVSSYRGGGEAAVRDSLYALVNNGTESAGYSLAMMASTGANEIPMGLNFGSAAGWEASFINGRETLLYQERDVEGGQFTLYTYELTDYGLSERKLIGFAVEDVVPFAEGVYFRRQEADSKGTALFFCAYDGKPERVLRYAGAYVKAGDKLLVCDGTEKNQLYLVSGLQSRQLDAGVQPESIISGTAYTGYIANLTAGAGELRVCKNEINGMSAKPKILDSGVTAIRVVK